MIARKQLGSCPRRFIAAALGGCPAAALVGLVPIASAQDQSAATPDNAVSDHRDQIEAMVLANKINLKETNEHGDTISVMPMALPHLFSRNTYQWRAGVGPHPATGTFASAGLWTKFAEVYKRATEASETVHDARLAGRADELKAKTAQLRTASNGCQPQYREMQ